MYHNVQIYELSHGDYFIDASHLLAQIQLKRQQETKCCSFRNIVELREIRDGVASFEKVTNGNICKMIDYICLE